MARQNVHQADSAKVSHSALPARRILRVPPVPVNYLAQLNQVIRMVQVRRCIRRMLVVVVKDRNYYEKHFAKIEVGHGIVS